MSFDVSKQGIQVATVHRNLTVEALYKKAEGRPDYVIASNGAMIAKSGAKTGRSPNDKRVVEEADTKDDIWWGKVNIPISEDSFGKLKSHALDFLNTKDEIYIVDGYAGWDPTHQVKVRIICTRIYHALFMHNMLIRPTG